MWINKQEWENLKATLRCYEERVCSLERHVSALESWKNGEIGKQPHEHEPFGECVWGNRCKYCGKPVKWCVKKESE